MKQPGRERRCVTACPGRAATGRVSLRYPRTSQVWGCGHVYLKPSVARRSCNVTYLTDGHTFTLYPVNIVLARLLRMTLCYWGHSRGGMRGRLDTGRRSSCLYRSNSIEPLYDPGRGMSRVGRYCFKTL